MTPEMLPSTADLTPDSPSNPASDAPPVMSAASPAPEIPYEGPTWEDDETTATTVLRALFTLLAAGFLGYAQWKAPANWPGTIGQNWGRWVWMSAVCNFALPLGIVWMFFGQSLILQEWLKDQKHNAWNYGWSFKNWKRHALIALACWAVFLPFLIYFAAKPEMKAAYADYLPVTSSARDWAFLLGTLVIYMFCWEWFFRGFLLFGVAQGLTVIPAIIFQAVGFGLSHAGKPQEEMWSAFAGGLILGTLAWREKSFFPAFLIHALIHVTWAILVLR